MNPSARGWLKKLLKFAEKNDAKAETVANLYPALKSVGFIYTLSAFNFKNSRISPTLNFA